MDARLSHWVGVGLKGSKKNKIYVYNQTLEDLDVKAFISSGSDR